MAKMAEKKEVSYTTPLSILLLYNKKPSMLQ
jgi:hypothetical protein